MKDFMTLLRNPTFLGQFRHLLSAIGGGLATKGYVAQSEWELWTGIGLSVLTLVLSATAPEKRQ